MNKIYTIGRDPSCDIVIVDPSDVVSRVHASLVAKGRGKYVLVDQGRNGTYVNGIKMSPSEEIPVTRKDVISFAHVADLDWNQIPKESSKSLFWVILGAVAVALAAIILWFVVKQDNTPVPEEPKQEIPAEAVPDSNAEKETVRDTVYIKPVQPVVSEKKKEPKKQPAREKHPEKETPAEEQVIDAIF